MLASASNQAKNGGLNCGQPTQRASGRCPLLSHQTRQSLAPLAQARLDQRSPVYIAELPAVGLDPRGNQSGGGDSMAQDYAPLRHRVLRGRRFQPRRHHLREQG